MQTPRYLAAVLILCASLAACGGGGGSGVTPGGGSTPTPTPTQSATSTTTNASGTVVNDANGAPLAGEKVVLEPWIAGATPLPAPQATTDTNGAFTLNSAPNGHYLLVIGNDTPGQTSTAVIHDNITLTGGNQTLKAPTLPALNGYTAPAWETNGDYRIATLDATTEVPCFTAWNNDRAAHTLSPAIPDEWLTENVRAQWAYTANGSNGSKGVNGGFITGVQVGTLGAADCQGMIDATFGGTAGPTANAAALSSHALWFGAIFKPFVISGSNNTAGDGELPYDPRFQSDISGLVWP